MLNLCRGIIGRGSTDNFIDERRSVAANVPLLPRVIPPATTYEKQHRPRLVRAFDVGFNQRVPAAAVWTAELGTGLEAGLAVRAGSLPPAGDNPEHTG
jgi:hypothetical protein